MPFKKILLFTVISFNIYSYNFLDKAYELDSSLGLGFGSSYINSSDFNVIPNLNMNTNFIFIETLSIYVNNRLLVNSELLTENNFSLGLGIRPFFTFRLLKNYFTKNNYIEYFYNSISFNVAPEVKTVFKNKILNLIGLELGISFNFLLKEINNYNFFIKLSYSYNFFEEINNINYNGFYFYLALGMSFRFGNSIDWLSANPNKAIKIHIK